MANGFKKLMRKQMQESFDNFPKPPRKPLPPTGWIRTLREALGMSSDVLAGRLGCTRENISRLEQREKKGTISLATLKNVAEALDCTLVYCLVPNEPLETILEKQARTIAKRRIAAVNHSMKLEQQGLNATQLQQQEDDLVRELLEGDPKKLWRDTQKTL